MNASFSIKGSDGKLTPSTATLALTDERVITITLFGSADETDEMSTLAVRIVATGLYESRATGSVPTKDGKTRHFVRLVRANLGISKLMSELDALGV